jgi:hypothetical protein
VFQRHEDVVGGEIDWEIDAGYLGAVDAGTGQVGGAEIDAAQIGLAEITVGEIESGGVQAAQIESAEIRAGEVAGFAGLAACVELG